MSLLYGNIALADPGHSGQMSLDQSKDILFEQFTPSTYGLQLMQAKDKFDYKSIIFGGMAEADLQYWHGGSIITAPLETYNKGHGIYLTGVTLDMLVNINEWGAVFVSGSDTQIGQGGPGGNYLYYQHAFIVAGNLERFPIYLLFGINYIPFALFSGTGTWDMPVTSDYFNPQPVPQLNVAYYKNNLNVNAFAFKDNVNYEYHYGTSFNYQVKSIISYGIGAGLFTNLKTNAAGNIATIKVRKNIVPQENLGTIWNINANIGYKIVSLTGDLLSGTNKILNASSNSAAYCLTLLYTPTLLDKVTTFGISQSTAFNFSDIPAALPGQDGVELALQGIKRTLAVSVSRPVYTDKITLGLDAEKILTYGNLQSYAYTLDLLIYI